MAATGRRRVVGIPTGAIEPETQDVRFTLAFADGNPLPLVATFGAAGQIIAALARMVEQLRAVLAARRAIGEVGGETVAAYQIQRPAPETVLLRLTTPQGVPYSFCIPRQTAADIAERLKNESARAARS